MPPAERGFQQAAQSIEKAFRQCDKVAAFTPHRSVAELIRRICDHVANPALHTRVERVARALYCNQHHNRLQDEHACSCKSWTDLFDKHPELKDARTSLRLHGPKVTRCLNRVRQLKAAIQVARNLTEARRLLLSSHVERRVLSSPDEEAHPAPHAASEHDADEGGVANPHADAAEEQEGESEGDYAVASRASEEEKEGEAADSDAEHLPSASVHAKTQAHQIPNPRRQQQPKRRSTDIRHLDLRAAKKSRQPAKADQPLRLGKADKERSRQKQQQQQQIS